jgi:hypothetical protein
MLLLPATVDSVGHWHQRAVFMVLTARVAMWLEVSVGTLIAAA